MISNLYLNQKQIYLKVNTMGKISGFFSLLSTVFWSVVFVTIGIGVGVFCIYHGIESLTQNLKWDEYVKVNATVTRWYVSSSKHTGVAHGTARTTVSWGLGCMYEYEAGSKKYTGYGRYEHAYNQEEAKKKVSKRKVGEKILVWYHPEKPNIPIMDQDKPEKVGSIWFIVFGLIIVVFLGGMTISVIKEKLSGEGGEYDE